LAAITFTVFGEILPVPATPGTWRLTAEPAFGADLARHARDSDANALSWSTIVWMCS